MLFRSIEQVVAPTLRQRQPAARQQAGQTAREIAALSLRLHRALLEAANDRAAAHGLQAVLEVVADSHPAIALYERSGWQLVGTQPATWANPDGTTPVLRGYVRPRPVGSGPGRREAAQLASRPG